MISEGATKKALRDSEILTVPSLLEQFLVVHLKGIGRN